MIRRTEAALSRARQSRRRPVPRADSRSRVRDASGDPGVLEAKAGDPGQLLLRGLPNQAPVASGQLVVTAGWTRGSLASLYPAGVPIGTISGVTPNEKLGHGGVMVAPAADIRHLATVQILTKPPSSPTAAPGHPSQPAWLSQLATRFAVLNKPPTALPAAIAKELIRFGVPSRGLAYAHRVVFAAGTIWIIPEPSELCAVVELAASGDVGGETCEPGDPLPGGLGMSAGGREHPSRPFGAKNPLLATKAGIVANDVASVHYKRRDGQPATQAITDNAFLVDTLPGAVVKRVR